jgi:signal transduction histidine kinase
MAGSKKIKYSVQMTFGTIFFLFLAVMIVLLNIFPTTSSRDVVFSTKQSALMSQATVLSSSLSALERLSAEGVEQVMRLIDAERYARIVVTDTAGGILYDSVNTAGELEDPADDVARALGGEAVFACRYTGDAFLSRTAAPILSYGNIIGAVYLYDRDSEQAVLIESIQTRLRNISILSGALTLLAIIFFTRALTRRLTALVQGMRIVREGDYSYRVAPRGGDEVTELTEEFNNMTRRLQSTEELRRRFVSDASHELRTPLASIRLLSDSIANSVDMDESTMREFVTDIGSEAERLQRTTEKLMKLTRMDSRVPVERVPVNVKKTVERTIHLLNPLALDKGVTIYTELAEDCVICAQEDDLYQIIFNLAENAIKYNSFGGNVFLRLERRDENAVLTVEDTGIGIPEADMPHIFDRFYRVDKARARANGGSGLGLSIVNDAVHTNGGTVRVEPRETVGTRFIVSFPLLPGAAAPAGEEAP